MRYVWYSETVPPLGAIKGDGIQKQLGRPECDEWTLLVREAAQNSWDAKEPTDTQPVRFALDLVQKSGEAWKRWRDLLLANAPSATELPLRQFLELEGLDILFVSDRGTTGLGGPTRADEAIPEAPHDYVSFVLNVGDPRDTDYGGGTYGFGKAVFYRSASAASILTYTRCRNTAGAVESRLVGCGLGESFVRDGTAYTGRHWFGIPGEDSLEPIVGADADELAMSLGFPEFEDDRLGTSVAMIAPELGERSREELGRRFADSISWHLWPKMSVGPSGAPAMEFNVSVDGQNVPIRKPSDHPVLAEFDHALGGLSNDAEVLTYGRAAEPVGQLALRTSFSPPPSVDEVGDEAGLGDGVRHCCLLRIPELVVDYLEGPRMPDERVWYAGVFKVLPSHDAVFADAEPPTHDAWTYETLKGHEQSVVRTTLRKLEEALRRHAVPRIAADSGDTDGVDGLAAASRYLGRLLAPVGGEGAGPRGGGSGGSGGERKVRLTGPPRWADVGGDLKVVQPFAVTAGSETTLEARLSVRVWGGGEKESPAGGGQPRLVGWRNGSGDLVRSERLVVPSGNSDWEVIVDSPQDTVTRIRVSEAIDRD